MMLQTRFERPNTQKKVLPQASTETSGGVGFSPKPVRLATLPDLPRSPSQKSADSAAKRGSTSALPPTGAGAGERGRRQIPVCVTAGQSRIASPSALRRAAPPSDRALPRLKAASEAAEGASGISSPPPPPASCATGGMEQTEDANFNPVPARRMIASPSLASPSVRRRETAGPAQPRPVSASSPVLSARSRSHALNDNHRSPPPRGQGVASVLSRRSADLQPTGDASEARRGTPNNAAGEGMEGEVTLDENVNPAVVGKTRGKALIIRRGASISATAPRTNQALPVGKREFRDSEAGPEVALLPEDLLGPAAAFFQDTAAVDLLAGPAPAVTSTTAAGRQSLLVRCDPRLARTRPATRRHRTQQEEGVSAHEKQLASKEDLIAFSPAEDSLKKRPVAPVGPSPAPPDVAQPAPAAAPAPAGAGQEHKTQELMLQEKLLKRDREIQTLQETVTKLKQQLAASQTTQQRMAKVMERHTCALAQLAASKVHLETQQQQQLQRVKVERDEAREEVANIEAMFADLHRKYEKSKALVAENRQTSDLVSAELEHALAQVSREQQRYDMLQQYAEDTMQRLQADMELEQKNQETETLRMSARLQLAENRATKLERENQEVTAICDELIQKMGGAR